jgi:D-alanyl-D-alanine carboxypeptidase
MRKIAVLLFSAVFMTAFTLPLTALTADMNISAHHAVLYEPTTGTILYEKNSSERAPMASTTKIMTALVALKYGDLDQKITIPEEACGIEGSSIYMQPGEILTLKDLLYALLLQSANDAATAIAIAIGGSVSDFAQMMNAEALSLGLENTHFTNPHGLDDPDHYTTARDLAKIAAAAMEIPTFRDMVSTVKYTIPHASDGDMRLLVNHNKLLRMYDGAVGVKTGFTKKSGRCLVGAAEKDGLTFITVTLDAPNDWNDHIRMFERGFEQLENRLLCAAGEFVCEVPLLDGSDRKIACTNAEPIYAVLPKNAPAPTVSVDLPHYLTAPAKAGKVVGTISYTYEGKTVADGSLIIPK